MIRVKAVIFAASAALLLAGCGGGGGHSSTVTVDKNSDLVNKGDLYYAYPANKQQDVTPKASIILSYMEVVDANESDYQLTAVDSDDVVALASIEVVTDGYNKLVPEGSSVVIKPAEDLATNTEYRLTVTASGKSKGLKLPTGFQQQGPDGELTFTTRPAFVGSLAGTQAEADFKVKYYSPDGSKEDPFVDFSSLTFSFTQPIDAGSVVLFDGTNADTATVKLTQNGEPVPATVLVSEQYMTIDPDNADCDNEPVQPNKDPDAAKAKCESTKPDLTPGEAVEIELTNGLKSRTGNTLEAFSKTLTPANTAPRGTLVLEAPATSDEGICFVANSDGSVSNPPGAKLSSLTGTPINCVPLFSPLLGDNPAKRHTESAQAGNVYTQLADVTTFPQFTPMRIKKAAILKGGALDVYVGGEVNTQIKSGDVSVTWLSDANGVMSANPYTANVRAPKQLIITADMTFDTEEPRTNGAFTQNLQHVVLVGVAISDANTNRFNADAIGAIEPGVMAADKAFGLLAFHMESYKHQSDLPDGVSRLQPKDDRDLMLLEWEPGVDARKPLLGSVVDPQLMPPAEVDQGLGDADNEAGLIAPGDPVILNFNKPLDKNSIKPGDTLTLTHNGDEQSFDWELVGTSLVIRPDPELAYGSPTEDSVYVVNYAGVADMNGNTPEDDYRKDYAGSSRPVAAVTFKMPVYVPPASGEGFAPVIIASYPGFPCVTKDADLPYHQGYCANGTAGSGEAYVQGDTSKPVDRIPVTTLPANRPIRLAFSQKMDPTSFELGKTFVVEQCADDTCSSATSLTDGNLTVEGKQVRYTPLNNWQQNTLYRYTLKSKVSGASCGEDALCALGNHPLQTALLNGPAPDQGGPDLVIYFKGGAATNQVFQLLRNLSASDVNANFIHDEGEAEAGFGNDIAVADHPALIANQAFPAALINSTQLTAVSKDDETNATTGAVNQVNVGCENGEVCPNDKYLYMTGALAADVVGYLTAAEINQLVDSGDIPDSSVPQAVLDAGGGLRVNIHPTQLVTSSADTYADVDLIAALVENVISGLCKLFGIKDCQNNIESLVPQLRNQLISTGTGVMRMRYQYGADDEDGVPTQPITGWIYSTAGGPHFHTNLDVYMDQPYLKPAAAGLELQHDLHNAALPTVKLDGALNILPDGRLQIRQVSQNAKATDDSIDIKVEIQLLGSRAGTMTLRVPENGIVLNYIGEPVVN